MLKIKYCYKDSDKTVESEQTLKHRNYIKTIEKAKAYNSNTESDVFIAEITNLNAKPRHTTILNYAKGFVSSPVILKSKHKVFSGNPFDCIYNIPMGEEVYD